MANNNKPISFTFGSPAAKPAVPGGLTFGQIQSTPAAPGAAPPAFNLTATPSGPSSGFSFGTPAAAPAFGIGAPAAAVASAPATTTSVSAGLAALGQVGAGAPPAFSGFSIPTGAATALPTLGAPATKTLPTFGASLGQPATTASATTTATTSTLTLPGAITAVTAAPATTTATVNPLTNLSTTTTTTQSANASAQQPTGALLNFCQLEEHINKWTLELEEQEKMFTNQATQINAWDRVLIENSDKIVSLNDAFKKVKVEQKALEHELEYIAAQHAELDECIKPLEQEMAKSQLFDPEREQTYLMADNLDTQLKQMGEDLKEVIEHLNEANKDRDPNDPIVQIGKILNAHMSSLQWIENSTSHITAKLENISKLQENLRHDNERSFRMNI